MKNKIAYCGEDCSVCPAYIATINDDEILRKKTAESWSHFGDLTKDKIECLGCKSTGPIFEPCNNCKIKTCCIEKNIVDCSYCMDIDACSQLTSPSRKTTYDRIKKMRENREI